MGATQVTTDDLIRIKNNADRVIISVVGEDTAFAGRISLGDEVILESPSVFRHSASAEQIMQDMIDFARSGVYFRNLRDPSCPVRLWLCKTPAEAEKTIAEIAAIKQR